MHINPRFWYNLNGGRVYYYYRAPWWKHAIREDQDDFLICQTTSLSDGTSTTDLIAMTDGGVTFAWTDGNVPDEESLPEYYRGENYKAICKYKKAYM